VNAFLQIKQAFLLKLTNMPTGIATTKGLKGRNISAHGVSRGLGASKKIPEAHGEFMNEAALASGMETDVLEAVCITGLSILSSSPPQTYPIV
jgi:hypothetical protein